MKICGWNKTTLLDYPGKVAATIFLGGCNFRCPFCHNSSLVLHFREIPGISMEELLAFLKKRKGILDGVCVTGGEPTIDPELDTLLREIKHLGYLVKLDSNGTRPQVLKNLVKDGLVDMIAMDIKSSPENYGKVAGVNTVPMERIQESIDFLMSGSIPYEFRTTVVRELHSQEDFRSIGKWLSGAEAYYLQAYKNSPEVLKPGFSSYTREELEHFRSLLQNDIPSTEIRGID